MPIPDLLRERLARGWRTRDGSLCPTSTGANPQLSVYGLTAQLTTSLAERLKYS